MRVALILLLTAASSDAFTVRSTISRSVPSHADPWGHRTVMEMSASSETETGGKSKVFNLFKKLMFWKIKDALNDDDVDGSVYAKPRRNVSKKENWSQSFQIWCVRHPKHPISKFYLPKKSLLEGVKANDPTYLGHQRLAFGPNFCVAGEVCLGEFDTVNKALTSPQARTFRLGTSRLDNDAFPMMNRGEERNVFLLSLSSEGAGGTGEHEAVRKAVVDYVTTKEAEQRQQDSTAKNLLKELGDDYQTMDHKEGGSFFTDEDKGLNAFFRRYVHYVLFGISPDDAAAHYVLQKLYYEKKIILKYFDAAGDIAANFDIMGAKSWPELTDLVGEIYEGSPALKNFKEDNPEYKNLTKQQLARACIPLMGIAALVGPKHLADSSMGGFKLPAYTENPDLAEFDTTKVWDSLDLTDRDAIEKYLFECGRLWNPVSSTHRVAQEPFTCKIRDKDVTFPEGTIINIPIILNALNEDFWGPTTFEFDHKRENLCPMSPIFHSCGDEHANRICPGREIALTMLIDVLQTCGNVRRMRYGVQI